MFNPTKSNVNSLDRDDFTNTHNPISKHQLPLTNRVHIEDQSSNVQHPQHIVKSDKKTRINEKLHICDKMQEELTYQYEVVIPELFHSIETQLNEVNNDFDIQTDGLKEIQKKLEDLQHDVYIPAWCDYMATICNTEYPYHKSNSDDKPNNIKSVVKSELDCDDTEEKNLSFEEMKEMLNQLNKELQSNEMSPEKHDMDKFFNDIDNLFLKIDKNVLIPSE